MPTLFRRYSADAGRAAIDRRPASRLRDTRTPVVKNEFVVPGDLQRDPKERNNARDQPELSGSNSLSLSAPTAVRYPG